jgi:hypothetical protein
MASLDGMTSKFRAVPRINHSSEATAKVTKRSQRASHVCGPCRRAKLRCDLNVPCSSCVKKDDVESCTYPNAQPGVRHGGSGRANIAEERILHLECLVKQLIDSQAASQMLNGEAARTIQTPPMLPSDPMSQSFHAAGENSSYVGGTHWSAILDDIQELKDVLSRHSPGQGSGINHSAPSASLPSQNHHEVIFGSAENYSVAEILSQYLPHRTEVDRLLAVYFQGETFIVPFIHSLHFRRRYQDFWADTIGTNPLWISMLFSLCCIANLIRAAEGYSPPNGDLKDTISSLRMAAGQCLVAGKYHLPQPYTVEALGLYAQIKNLWTLDPCREAGAILSIGFRMAYEMGYHRDPDSLGGSLSPFEGEMRSESAALDSY